MDNTKFVLFGCDQICNHSAITVVYIMVEQIYCNRHTLHLMLTVNLSVHQSCDCQLNSKSHCSHSIIFSWSRQVFLTKKL